MPFINIENNKCPICLVNNLSWNLKYSKTQMEMFKCGHGTCKQCYRQMQDINRKCGKGFSCPLCRAHEQIHTIGFNTTNKGKWITFAEWYLDFEIYIMSGVANNILQNTVFGKQLLRITKTLEQNNKPIKMKRIK